MNFFKFFLKFFILFLISSIPVFSYQIRITETDLNKGEIKTSDVRLELISEISALEEDLHKLRIKKENTDNPKDKKIIQNKINAIEEKLKKLKEQLEDYDKHMDTIG